MCQAQHCSTAPCMQVVQAVQGCQLETGLTSWQEQAASAWLPQADSAANLPPAPSWPAAGHAWLQAAAALAAANGLPGSVQACSAGATTGLPLSGHLCVACAAHGGNQSPVFAAQGIHTF